ncbi:L-type lectin-domain containing receptor kinase VII.1-like [Cornus florida]|uniref:L-type lectin-domain containing receptor kinase VII.1-like n=1 Tax=Cornus florida TaxID=4283 RepID=UPI002898C638|nr:L-type lectin-domain containing receptor kinase VII.1-like [Cornus florida]
MLTIKSSWVTSQVTILFSLSVSLSLSHTHTHTHTMNKHLQTLLLLHLLHLILCFQTTFSTHFVFNGFDRSDISLYGNATVDSGILTLTNASAFSIGRALYPSKILTKDPNQPNYPTQVVPFNTSFVFSIAPDLKSFLPGHGFVFLFVPFTGIQGASPDHFLGFLNGTNNGDPNNHVFGIEFDVFKNQEFGDISDNHVGINVNSLTSTSAHQAGYWPDNDKSFKELKLNNGKKYQVWMEYTGFSLRVTMAPVSMKRPKRPLLHVPLHLPHVCKDEMYVGFTASTGHLAESHKIFSWSFSTFRIFSKL